MMKKIFVFLLLVVCCLFIVYSQTPTTKEYDFSYGFFAPTKCYIEHESWKISHGSPCYGKHPINSQHYYLQLEQKNGNGIYKSEGLFTNYSFSKCKNYKIEIQLRDKYKAPGITMYAANGLTEKIDTTCNVGILPIVSDKFIISYGPASCAGIGPFPLDFCTITIPPNNNEYWNPNKDYSQFWITSEALGDTSAFVISKIIIYDFGNVPSSPPTMPGNLRITSISGTQISIAWDPSTDQIGVEKYQIYCNGSLEGTVQHPYTSYTIRNLKECKNYNIEVRAVNIYCNNSPKAAISAKTPPEKDYIILNQPVILANYPDKTHIERAGISVTLQPGFSVKANNSQEFFKAMIGCDGYGKEMEQEDEDLYLSEKEEPQNVKNEDESQFINEEDVLKSVNSVFDINHNEFVIYPNPTTGNFTVSGEGLNHIEIYDVQGRLLLTHPANLTPQTSINVSQFVGGIYFVKMYSEMGDVVVKRLVIVK